MAQKKKKAKKTGKKGTAKKAKFLFQFLIDTSEATGVCQLQPGATNKFGKVSFSVQKEALGDGDIVRVYAALGEMKPIKTLEDALLDALNYALALESTYADFMKLASVGVERGKKTLVVEGDQLDVLRGGGQLEVRVANGLRMPNKKRIDYSDIDGPSPGTLPKKGATMLRDTFRGALEQYYDREGLPLAEAEERAARTAWAQVKRYYYKQGGKWKKRKQPKPRTGNKHVPPNDEYAHNVGTLNAYADEAIYLSDPQMAQHVAYQAHVSLEGSDKNAIVGKLKDAFPGTSFSRRSLNQGGATEVLEAKRIVDAANEDSAALRAEFEAMERGSPREVEDAQLRAKAARRQLRALTGARRQLYGSMFFGTGGAALGAAIGGVPGAAIGALAGATAGQLLLRPRGIKEEANTGPRATDSGGGAFAGPRSPRSYPRGGMRPRHANGRSFNPAKPHYLIYIVSCDGVELVGDEEGLAPHMFEELDIAVGYATAAQYDADFQKNPRNERYDAVAVYPIHGHEDLVFSTRADGYTDKGKRMRERNGERSKDACGITGYAFNNHRDARDGFVAMQQAMLDEGLDARALIFGGEASMGSWIPMLVGLGNQPHMDALAAAASDIGRHPDELIFVLAPPKGKEIKAIDAALTQEFGKPSKIGGSLYLREANKKKRRKKKRGAR